MEPVGPASDAPPPWERRPLQIGGWRVTPLSDGFLRLDGGGMWGVTPRVLWERWTPPADDNTILLAIRPFLLERDGLKVVLEPGMGERWEEKWRGIYHMRHAPTLLETLGACDVAPEDVTHVVASHCHWDHIGAAVSEREGVLVPTFPNATFHAPRIELDVASDPDPVRAASYRPEDVEPLVAAGVVRPFEGTTELLPGLVAHVLGGHSDGVSVLTIGPIDPGERAEPGETAIFWSDVVPTTHHVNPSAIMAFDIDVARSYEVRSAWLDRAIDGGWLGMFFHDVDHAFARIERADRRHRALAAGA